MTKKGKAAARAAKGIDRGAAPNRLTRWLLIGAVVVVAVLLVVAANVVLPSLLFMRRETTTGAGRTAVSTDITLVTSDKNDVDCMGAQGLGAYHCGFTDPKTEFSIDESHRLRPYFTADRRLYLVPGLFLQPAIEQRYRSEPPNKPREQLRRFTARCNLVLLGELDNVHYRWLPTAPWSLPAKVQVAEPRDCRVEG